MKNKPVFFEATFFGGSIPNLKHSIDVITNEAIVFTELSWPNIVYLT